MVPMWGQFQTKIYLNIMVSCNSNKEDSCSGKIQCSQPKDLWFKLRLRQLLEKKIDIKKIGK